MKRILLLTLLFIFSMAYPVFADDSASGFKSTGLPLPRFAALKSARVYARAGPDQRYPVTWVYQRPGMPVEITQEYDAWRKIRDVDGGEGWVNKILLSGKRMVLVRSKAVVDLKEQPDPNARIMAHVEPRVVAKLEKCTPTWCRIDADGYKGWLQRNLLWGIYANEEFN